MHSPQGDGKVALMRQLKGIDLQALQNWRSGLLQATPEQISQAWERQLASLPSENGGQPLHTTVLGPQTTVELHQKERQAELHRLPPL